MARQSLPDSRGSQVLLHLEGGEPQGVARAGGKLLPVAVRLLLAQLRHQLQLQAGRQRRQHLPAAARGSFRGAAPHAQRLVQQLVRRVHSARSECLG